MKKIILVGGALVVVVAVVLAVAFFSLDSIVKRSVETVGPMVTKVDVTVGSVGISAFSGSGKLGKFFVGNPPGFKSPAALKVGEVELGVDPKSLLSGVIVVREISVKDAEITMEGSLSENNLTKILANVKEFSGTNTAPADTAAEKKVQKKLIVNDFLIEGAKVNLVLSLPVLGNQSLGATLPTIHLTDIGKSEGGITSDELISVIIKEITSQAIQVATREVSKLGGSALDLGKNLGKNVTGAAGDSLNKATDTIGGFFKKK